MGDLETRLLRSFLAAAEELHFARAASRLQITPPTMTAHIKRLERRISAKLFTRTNQQVQLTDAGRSFVTYAREIIHQIDEAGAVVRKTERGEIGLLELGCMFVNLFDGVIPKIVSQFRLAYPSIDVTIHHFVSMDQINAIARNDLDCGFARLPPKLPTGLHGFNVMHDSLLVAVPANHPLASAKTIEPAALRNQGFINFKFESDMAFWRQTDVVASAGNFTPKIVKRAHNLVEVLAHVSAGLGVAIVAEPLKRLQIPNVVYRPISGMQVPQTATALVYRRNETSAVTRAFIKFVRDNAPISIHSTSRAVS